MVGWGGSLQSEDGGLQRYTKVSGGMMLRADISLQTLAPQSREASKAHSPSVLFLMGKARSTKTPNKPPPLLPPTQQPCVLAVTNLAGMG